MKSISNPASKFAASLMLALLLLAMPKTSSAGSLGADTIALFPKEIGEFAYADLKKARALPWFPQLQEQMLPDRFRQFEKFLASAGVDPNSQVEELAWGLVPDGMTPKDDKSGPGEPTGEQIVGIALGSYSPDSTEAYFKRQKLPTFKSHGYNLYAFGTGSGANDLFFFFLDSSKAAFGHRQLLEKMIDIRFGGDEGLLRNEKLYPLINEANGTGLVWAVLNPAYTRLAMHQLAPEVQQFPEAAKLVQRMDAMLITITASSGIEGKFQAECATPDDANTLSQLMRRD
jgi:hypothetical protein